jgi:hypothetical protein
MYQDFEKWTQQWDAAQKTELFKAAPKPPQKTNVDFFGQYPTVSDDTIRDVDAQYWQDVYKKSSHSGEYPDPLSDELLSEESKEKEIGKTADAMANAQNPIYPNTAGKDQEINTDKIWKDVDDINELSDLKVRLEKLESKYNSADSEAKSVSSYQKQIDDLRKRIDDLSDAMSGNRFDPSQP